MDTLKQTHPRNIRYRAFDALKGPGGISFGAVIWMFAIALAIMSVVIGWAGGYFTP